MKIQNPYRDLNLRNRGKTVSYDCPKEVAEILMETNVLQWNDFLKACRFNEGSMVGCLGR